MSLTGKVCIVTGASKGIGRAVVERLARDGASVVINYLTDTAAADKIVASIGADRALAVQADVSKLADIERVVDAAVRKFSKIDFIMPCAGLMPMIDFEHVTEDSYARVFDINVKGPMFLAQKAVPHMKPGSRVVFVSTGVCTATGVQPPYMVYAASKGAVDQMTRVLAKDLGRKGITVNAIAPGPTATELYFDGKPEQVVNLHKSLSPFNELGTPEDMASVAAFLARDESRWVSGQVIRVNGANMV